MLSLAWLSSAPCVRGLRAALVDAALDPIDVVPQVLAALAVEDPWQSISSGLRDAVDGDIDLADGIMAAVGGAELPERRVAAVLEKDSVPTADEARGILLSAMVDGELSREKRAELSEALADDGSALDQMTQFADLGRVLRTVVELETRQSNLDGLWEEICLQIGVEDPEHVPGWEKTAGMLRAAVQEHATLSASEEGGLYGSDHEWHSGPGASQRGAGAGAGAGRGQQWVLASDGRPAESDGGCRCPVCGGLGPELHPG